MWLHWIHLLSLLPVSHDSSKGELGTGGQTQLVGVARALYLTLAISIILLRAVYPRACQMGRCWPLPRDVGCTARRQVAYSYGGLVAETIESSHGLQEENYVMKESQTQCLSGTLSDSLG